MEVITVGSKTLVMDGAHNGQKMATFVSSFKHLFPGIKPAVAIAVKDSKEAEEIVEPLADLASEVIVTTFRTSPGMPAKSMNPNVLATLFKTHSGIKVVVAYDLESAYDLLLQSKASVLILTGSFYFISQLRHLKQLAQ
jgi:dihydrofolate synthase/folylpolyglutamate synthase